MKKLLVLSFLYTTMVQPTPLQFIPATVVMASAGGTLYNTYQAHTLKRRISTLEALIHLEKNNSRKEQLTQELASVRKSLDWHKKMRNRTAIVCASGCLFLAWRSMMQPLTNQNDPVAHEPEPQPVPTEPAPNVPHEPQPTTPPPYMGNYPGLYGIYLYGK